MNTPLGNVVWYQCVKRLSEFNNDDRNWEGVLLLRKAPHSFDFTTDGENVINIGDAENALNIMTDDEVKELPDEDPALNWHLPIDEAAGFDLLGFIKNLAITWPGQYRVFNYYENSEQGIIIAFCLNDPIRSREGLRRAIAHRLNVWATNI